MLVYYEEHDEDAGIPRFFNWSLYRVNTLMRLRVYLDLICNDVLTSENFVLS